MNTMNKTRFSNGTCCYSPNYRQPKSELAAFAKQLLPALLAALLMGGLPHLFLSLGWM